VLEVEESVAEMEEPSELDPLDSAAFSELEAAVDSSAVEELLELDGVLSELVFELDVVELSVVLESVVVDELSELEGVLSVLVLEVELELEGVELSVVLELLVSDVPELSEPDEDLPLSSDVVDLSELEPLELLVPLPVELVELPLEVLEVDLASSPPLVLLFSSKVSMSYMISADSALGSV